MLPSPDFKIPSLTRLKTLFQPQDDENTDKTYTMSNSPRVIKKGTFKLHHALLGSNTVYEISVPTVAAPIERRRSIKF